MNHQFRLGLCGAQGSGKTTLAKTFSEQTGVPYFDAGVRHILKRNGFDCRAEMTLPEYFRMQKTVCKELFASYPTESFVTDRTPIDVMAYTLAYVPPTISTDTKEGYDIELGLTDIISELRLATEKHFSNIVMARGTFVSGQTDTRTDRASVHLGYRLKIESLIEGEMRRFSEFTNTAGVVFQVIPSHIQDLSKRVDSLIGVYEKHIDSYGYETSTFH
ncbi:AAA family ATPase [Xenorhabdus sp. PR6a]|uniref:AAA family ATPase n=1 Tax=Xenorhabdus sp. PR6a TaxID=3025877 RepID=UPI002359C212|nr:AAA family ATPase [Xenorhabdus sp. PR6a]MDC9581929.1 AAA family ATPase [Xenorhabdus sp. PR6a]